MRSHIINLSHPASALYVHIPFCHSKCSYCDFYSKPLRSADTDSYVDALIIELNLRRHEFLPPSAAWHTVYIGGGTPSILPLQSLEKLVNDIGNLQGTVEFTIEANPEDVTSRWLAAIARLGINRVSMGVQSFSDMKLAAIGRKHKAAQSIKAIESLAGSRLDYSLDLIYGLPGQTVEEWHQEIRALLQFKPPHFSAYLLSYEPGTRLTILRDKGAIVETDEEEACAMYTVLCQEARKNDYEHYEISNFATRGQRSIHNSSYWNQTPYLGVGPGAHSFDGKTRSYNPSSLKLYMEKISARQLPLVIEPETPRERINDILVTALRTSDGLDFQELKSIYDFQPFLLELKKNINSALEQGRLCKTPVGRLVIPETHWLTSDKILRALIL